MAILVGFALTKLASYEEIVLDKLRATYEAIKYFQNSYFISETAELWYDAPSEALGGELRTEIPAQNPYEAYQKLLEILKPLNQDLRRMIIIFRGVWRIENVELAGYFSLQNPRDWRKIYGDLEISAYGKGEIEDIVDALWLTNDIQGIVDSFVGDLNRNLSSLRIGLNQVVFCRGIWNKYEPANIMAILIASERRGLLRIFYDARRKEKSWNLEPMAKPLDTNFLLDTLEQTPIVEDRINERLERSLTTELPAGSKLYIAKNRDSFGKLYDDVTKAIIEPALARLPKDESVRRDIEEGLKDYSES